MRVNDLSKELGKPNKEVLAFLNAHGAEVKSHMSNITDDQADIVRKAMGAGGGSQDKQSSANENKKADSDTVKKGEKMTSKDTSEPQKASDSDKKEAENKKESTDGAPRKKKLMAVFRPQNAQQPRGPRPAPRQSVTGRVIRPEIPEEKKTEEKPAVSEVQVTKDNSPLVAPAKESITDVTLKEDKIKSGEGNPQTPTKDNTEKIGEKKTVKESAEPVKQESPSQNTPVRENSLNRRGQIQNPNRADRAPRQGYQQGTRTQQGRTGQNGSQGSNGSQGTTARQPYNPNYQNRNNKTPYRPGNTGTGRPPYQGNSNRTGGAYQAGQNRSGGYSQGAKPGGGFQGRPGGNGFSGRPSAGFGQRPGQRQAGQRDARPTDGPLVKKTTGNRTGKNNFKYDKNDKRHRTEDGPGKGKLSRHPFIMPEKPKEVKVEDDIKEIIIPEVLNIRELATKLKLQPASIIKKLFLKGQMLTVNSELTFEQAEEIALEYDVICTREEKVDVIAELLKEDDEAEADLLPRPPVVCVMGHVDHGKTSLLDAIRKTNVSSHEAGGITQRIGAYMVKINDKPITFLDTPGHEAFTAMRMRGAQATDIAVLVVAADDGVMPQTIEAINHAKAAGVEIIVAVNKMDKPSANIDRVKQELAEYELIPEDWGGTTVFCPVSAKSQEGISNLLEMITITADVKELKANPNRHARGIVIEAELDKGKGPVASVLVQKGTLHVGDFIAAGSCYGKVRAMTDDRGRMVKLATPSMPVEILGLDNVPNAGEIVVATENDKEAKNFAATFISEEKNKLIEETKAKLSLDDLFSQIKAGNVKELPIIVKADVQGSVEAVRQSLVKLSNDEVQVKIIHGGVGAINESDVSLASASNAIIIGFNVRPDTLAKATADHEKVDLRLYKVIYQAIEDVEAAMKGMLEPIYEEKVIGHAEIRQLFKASGVGTIGGSYVLDGKFERGCKARITRDGVQIFDGPLASLKRFKDDVKEVATGYECGLVFEKFNDLAEGDQVEAYAMVEVPRT